ncbi:pisatin demethylase [Stipitochalara longipes BDJ]|nr:pisatin demethylase [Stipitochalara longipes BDJ]
MGSSLEIWAVLVALGGYILISRLRTWLRLRHIPGPALAGFSKAWLLRKALGGRFHLDTAEACEKYGSLARLGPNELVTSDPNILRRMSAIRSPYRRSEWYDGMRLEPEYNHMVSERNEERHLELRTKCAMGYSGKDNAYLEKSIDDNIAKLIHLLESKYLSIATEFKPVDMARQFHFLTLDIISDIAFGTAFGNLEADNDVSSYIKTMETMFPLIILLGTWPALARIFFSKPLRRFLPKETDTVGMGKLMGIGKQVVAERFGPNKKVRRDMLGSFIAHGLTQRDAQTETLLQIGAGSDTSATAMSATFLYIATHPTVQLKFLAELTSVSLSSPITDTVPSGGDTLNGIFVPAGTAIGWSPFTLMRDEKIWGNDARAFRPERWLEGTREERMRMDGLVEMCFGYGRYQCLGKNIALIELGKVFVELLRNFEFQIVDPTKPWESFNAGLFLQSDFWVRVTRRVPRF